MPDQQDTDVAASPVNDLSMEIGSSLASVWARYVGARPEEAETKLDGVMVRWTVPGGAPEFEKGMAAEVSDEDAGAPVRSMPAFKRDTSAAVARLTHRKVMAMISKHDAKSGLATETFILERSPMRY